MHRMLHYIHPSSTLILLLSMKYQGKMLSVIVQSVGGWVNLKIMYRILRCASIKWLCVSVG